MKNFLILILTLFLMIMILINNYEIKLCIIEAINIWKNNIFPSLFPFFILSDILINYGFAYYMSILFEKAFKLIFNSNGISSFVFFLSIISGFPSNAIYINDLYSKELIDSKEATKLLTFTHFSSPLFIIGFIGNIVGMKLSIVILISHYISNIIIGILFKNYTSYVKKYIKLNPYNFTYVFKKSIKQTLDNLLIILGIVTFFMIINNIINNLNVLPFIKYISNLFLEMTNGIIYISKLNINNLYKSILIVSVISFGGFSVHLQVLNIFNEAKIKYQIYLLARIIHAILSSVLVFIIYNLIRIY